jgi:hypothetical protein
MPELPFDEADRIDADQAADVEREIMASVLDLAVDGGLVAKTPEHGIKLPRLGCEERQFLTVEEVEQLANAAGRYGTFVRVLAYCGPRFMRRERFACAISTCSDAGCPSRG